MSLILKGIDIPKDAAYFKLSFYDGNRENEYGVSGSLKPYITQIPKGHGRLIDADILQGKAFEDNFKYKISERDLYVVNVYIEHAPVIIEAEE